MIAGLSVSFAEPECEIFFPPLQPPAADWCEGMMREEIKVSTLTLGAQRRRAPVLYLTSALPNPERRSRAAGVRQEALWDW
jgi:hypothetical protein